VPYGPDKTVNPVGSRPFQEPVKMALIRKYGEATGNRYSRIREITDFGSPFLAAYQEVRPKKHILKDRDSLRLEA